MTSNQASIDEGRAMLYVVGDVHLRSEEPFFSAIEEFLSDLLSGCDADDCLIFTGDFFHRARPYSEELKFAREFFERCKSKKVKVIILAGNHEYFRDRGTWAEDVFDKYDIEFITSPSIKWLHNVQIIFLPWMPASQMQKELGVRDMKSYYAEKLPGMVKLLHKGKNTYAIYHFEDETVFAGIEDIGVDLSCLENKFDGPITKLGGHIHNPSKNYIGAPYATRRDETGFDRRVAKIDPETESCEFIEVPTKIEFKTLLFDELKEQKYGNGIKYIIKILDAPSFEAVKSYVDSKPNIWLDDYELKFNEERTVLEDKGDALESVRDFLELYIKQNKIDPDTANYLLSVF